MAGGQNSGGQVDRNFCGGVDAEHFKPVGRCHMIFTEDFTEIYLNFLECETARVPSFTYLLT